MQGKTIYRLEPRLKSMSKAEGNFWVPNAAITEHALTRRLGELDKEKTMFQADYRYRQRELQKELRNMRASKPAESVRRSQSRRFSTRHSAGPTSLTDMIDRYKRKRTDQEFLQDQLRQRRDSLVSSLGSQQGHGLTREDTTDSDLWDIDRPGRPDPPPGTILDDMRTALTIARQPEGLNTDTNAKEVGVRRPQEPRLRRSTYRDVTYPRGLSHRSSKRRQREPTRGIKHVPNAQSKLLVMHNSTTEAAENGEDINEDLLDLQSDIKTDSIDASVHQLKSDDDGTMLSMTHGSSQSKNVAMVTVPDKGVVSNTDLKDRNKLDQSVEGLGLQRNEKQLTITHLDNNNNLITRRCSEPVIVGDRENRIEHLNVNSKKEYMPEETLPGFKKHVIVRRFSENDKYQCNFIKGLMDDDESPTDSDKETVEMSESDVIWDDVRRCRYLRGYDPPIMIMPKEEITLFVFGRDENDILELRREKPLGL